jgi:hypothetical protein
MWHAIQVDAGLDIIFQFGLQVATNITFEQTKTVMAVLAAFASWTTNCRRSSNRWSAPEIVNARAVLSRRIRRPRR